VTLAIAGPLATDEDFIVATVDTDGLSTIGVRWWTDRVNEHTSHGEGCGPSKFGVIQGELPKLVDGVSCGRVEQIGLTAL
jgi:hypothetical protein